MIQRVLIQGSLIMVDGNPRPLSCPIRVLMNGEIVGRCFEAVAGKYVRQYVPVRVDTELKDGSVIISVMDQITTFSDSVVIEAD